MRVASTRFIGGWENDARIISVLSPRYDVAMVWYETGRLFEDEDSVDESRAPTAVEALSSEPNSRIENNIFNIVNAEREYFLASIKQDYAVTGSYTL
jgi:hypothetical protein